MLSVSKNNELDRKVKSKIYFRYSIETEENKVKIYTEYGQEGGQVDGKDKKSARNSKS
jgi:hypothetical protein